MSGALRSGNCAEFNKNFATSHPKFREISSRLVYSVGRRFMTHREHGVRQRRPRQQPFARGSQRSASSPKQRSRTEATLALGEECEGKEVLPPRHDLLLSGARGVCRFVVGWAGGAAALCIWLQRRVSLRRRPATFGARKQDFGSTLGGGGSTVTGG